MSGILENTETERLDLFTVDAVAEIAEGATQGKTPLAYNSAWDDGVNAWIVVGVHLWETTKPIHDALPDDTE